MVIVAPASEAAVIPALRDECAQEDGHGWGSLSVVVMASERAPAVAAVQAMRERLGRVLLVPLSVAPGPYVAHVSNVAQAGGVDHTTQTLHATEALTKLLLSRCAAPDARPPDPAVHPAEPSGGTGVGRGWWSAQVRTVRHDLKAWISRIPEEAWLPCVLRSPTSWPREARPLDH